MKEDAKQSLKSLIEAEVRSNNIREKELRFCKLVVDLIVKNHGNEGLNEVWFQTDTGYIGRLKNTNLEKWYWELKDYRDAFWELVERGEITGYLPGSSLPIED